MEAGLDIILTVDWEGVSLESENLKRIQSFKQRWSVPIVHYMNPAYFTDPGLSQKFHSSIIKKLIMDDDELGLHIHTPRHFVEAAGVSFRSQPSFSTAGDSHLGAQCGQEVMLHAYSKTDFAKFLSYSYSVFENYGFPAPRSFRAGGWMLDEEKIAVLAEFKILIDSSAAPAEVLDGSCWQGESLQRYLSILWGNINKNSQPYWHPRGVLEVPNNLGAIDYWKTTDVTPLVSKNVKLAESKRNILVVTAHQESAAQHFSLLDQFMEQLKQEKKVSVRFINQQELLPVFAEASSF